MTIDDLLVLDKKELDEYLNFVDTFDIEDKKKFVKQTLDRTKLMDSNYEYMRNHKQVIRDKDTLRLYTKMLEFEHKRGDNLSKIMKKCIGFKDEVGDIKP